MENRQRRLIAFDLLRAIALVRIFMWHGTGWAALTWIGAIPVMFFIAGVFAASSIERSGYVQTLRNRLRRILLPYWVFAGAAVLSIYVADRTMSFTWRSLGWVVPVIRPEVPEWEGGWLVGPLWYIHTYVWLFALAGLLFMAVRRNLLATLSVLAGSAVVLEYLFGFSYWEVQNVVSGAFFLVLGMGWQRRVVLQSSNQRYLWIAGAAVAAFVAAMVAMPKGYNVNDSHTLALLLGILWVSLAVGVLPGLERLGEKLRGVVSFIGDRSMTIYLYHAPVIGLTYAYIAGAWGVHGVVGAGLSVMVAAGLTLLVVQIAGVVEDYAARRHTARETKSSVLALTVVGAVVLIGPAVSHETVNLPPAPSRAPQAAQFETPHDMVFLMPGSSGHAAAGLDVENQFAGPGGVQANPAVHTGDASKEMETSKGTSDETNSIVAIGPKYVEVNGRIPAWKDLAPQAGKTEVEAIEAVLSGWLAEEQQRGRAHPGGVGISILQPGRQSLSIGIAADGAIVPEETILEYASITKSFTAAMLLRAVEAGMISMDEPLGRLEAAPWFTLVESTTLRQLLTHRSGLVNYADTAVWKNDWQDIKGWETALQAVEQEGLMFPPGAKVGYSSSNYIVAGLIVQELYGTSVEAAIGTELLRPLGLDDVEVRPAKAGAPGTGTGNMRGTLVDLSRWAVAMWRDQAVLGEVGNTYAKWTDSENLIGFGSFSYCPCSKRGSKVETAGIGANGAGASVRYYRGIDTVVAVRVPSGMTGEVEELIASVLRAVQ
jgi:CubicO group peptidase (beta-lactamase class C family)/peptidoglycan/LPS O-acetylase OafA/YrhL